MRENIEISEILKKVDIDESTKTNLLRLFEFTQYLYDDDENLTKTLNLAKKGKDKLIERMQELFEQDLSESELKIEDGDE